MMKRQLVACYSLFLDANSTSHLENSLDTNPLNFFNTKHYLATLYLKSVSISQKPQSSDSTETIHIFNVDTASVLHYSQTLIMSFTLRLPSDVCPLPLKQELDGGEPSTTKPLLSGTLTSIKGRTWSTGCALCSPPGAVYGHQWMDVWLSVCVSEWPCKQHMKHKNTTPVLGDNSSFTFSLHPRYHV